MKHNDALVVKFFLVESFNSYFTLFYLGFVKQNIYHLSIQLGAGVDPLIHSHTQELKPPSLDTVSKAHPSPPFTSHHRRPTVYITCYSRVSPHVSAS